MFFLPTKAAPYLSLLRGSLFVLPVGGSRERKRAQGTMGLFPLPLVLWELTFFFQIGHFRVAQSLRFKAKCKAIYMKMTFILLQVKLIFTRK